MAGLVTKETPFRIVYGRPPPPLVPFQVGTATTQAVETLLQERDIFQAEVRDHLHQAQQHAKH